MLLRFHTALGTCGITWSGDGVTGVLLPGTRAPAGDTRAHHNPEVPDAIGDAVAAIVSLLAGERTDLRAIALD